MEILIGLWAGTQKMSKISTQSIFQILDHFKVDKRQKMDNAELRISALSTRFYVGRVHTHIQTYMKAKTVDIL